MTAFFMVTMFVCTALAVDIGLRNDLLARDQHAIDAATIAAVRRVNVPSYPGEPLSQRIAAATKVAETIVWQNTGLEVTLWTTCSDPSHLADLDPSQGGNCISFGLNSIGERVARVILPPHSVRSIFGGVAGFDEYQLAALANADGNGCNGNDDPNCAANTTTTTWYWWDTTTTTYWWQTTTTTYEETTTTAWWEDTTTTYEDTTTTGCYYACGGETTTTYDTTTTTGQETTTTYEDTTTTWEETTTTYEETTTTEWDPPTTEPPPTTEFDIS